LPVITARIRGSRGGQNEVDAGVERGEVSLDVVALRGNSGVKIELVLFDALAVVIASSLQVITARIRGSRGIQNKVDAGDERRVVSLDVITL